MVITNLTWGRQGCVQHNTVWRIKECNQGCKNGRIPLRRRFCRPVASAAPCSWSCRPPRCERWQGLTRSRTTLRSPEIPCRRAQGSTAAPVAAEPPSRWWTPWSTRKRSMRNCRTRWSPHTILDPRRRRGKQLQQVREKKRSESFVSLRHGHARRVPCMMALTQDEEGSEGGNHGQIDQRRAEVEGLQLSRESPKGERRRAAVGDGEQGRRQEQVDHDDEHRGSTDEEEGRQHGCHEEERLGPSPRPSPRPRLGRATYHLPFHELMNVDEWRKRRRSHGNRRSQEKNNWIGRHESN